MITSPSHQAQALFFLSNMIGGSRDDWGSNIGEQDPQEPILSWNVASYCPSPLPPIMAGQRSKRAHRTEFSGSSIIKTEEVYLGLSGDNYPPQDG